MTTFNISAILSGEANCLTNPPVYSRQRLGAAGGKTPLVANNVSVALASGVPAADGVYAKLTFFVSSGPSDLTLKMADGSNFTLSALATNTFINLDVQFYMATWTGTATAAAYYME